MRLLCALLASTLPIAADGAVQLLPAGPFGARDGRPGPGRKWQLDDARGRAIADRMNARAKLTRIVVDYEHQTLHSATNGQPAPAAGWIGDAVQWLDGKGLVTPVDWTPRAAKSIADREYAYLSPVIHYDRDSLEVHDVSMAALTNFPAIEGMDALVAALNAQLTSQEPDMALLTALLTALGLPAATAEADALAAVSALKARPAIPAAVATALGLKADAAEAAALTAIQSLQDPRAAGADTKPLLALITDLQGQVAKLSAQMTQAQGDRVEQAVDAAIAANKITAAQRESYLKLGKSDMALLTAILDKAPVVEGMGGQSGGGEGRDGDGAAALTTDQKKIAQQLGLDEKVYAAQLKAAKA